MTQAATEKRPLIEAEDKITNILKDLDEPMRALLYKVLYLQGWRITYAEDLVRKNFGVTTPRP